MNARSLFQGRPTTPPSHRQLALGCFGLVLLGAMVIVHAIAISVFLWSVTAKPSGVVALVLLWTISAVAMIFVARGLRRFIELWRRSASSTPVSR
jgi:membrane protein YdbS with pleckstrin-like domain